MNWVKTITSVMAISLALPIFLCAQSDLRKAEKYIDLQHYGSAIALLNNYESLSQDQPALILLGRAYKGANQLKAAKSYFDQANQLGELPISASLEYGLTLMALEEYDGALQQFSLYGAEHPEESMRLIAQCGYAIQHKDDPSDFKVTAEYLNTSRRDMSPVYFESDIVYLSDREDMGKNISGSTVELLKSTRDSKGILKFPKRIKSLTGQGFDIVNLSYNPTMGMVAVTRGQAGFLTNTTSDKCTLYIGAYNKHGSVEDLKPYEFNLTDYSTGMASFSADGMTMYFASDRAGGYGGYDLYESKLMNGQWSSPINLGDAVNTPGNEVTPYAIGDLLLFASDGREGFGGYDLFKVYNQGTGYGIVTNLGTGINSAADDFSMTYNPVTNDGYLVSTRATGKGLEDIYRYTTSQPLLEESKSLAVQTKPAGLSTLKAEYEILKGMAIDNLGNPVGMVEVQASADDTQTIVSAKTNDKGLFTIPLQEGVYYTLTFEGAGFQKTSRTIMMEHSRTMPLLKVEMTADALLASKEEEVVAKPVSLNPNPKPSKAPTPAVATTNRNPTKTKETVTVSKTESPKPVVAPTPEVKESVSSTANSYKAPEASPAYAIQVAALSKKESVSAFSKLKDLGTLYTLFDDKIYRVRCGLFSSREEAESILRRIKARGYEQSYIVAEKPNDNTHLVMMDFGGSIPTSSTLATAQDAGTAATTSAISYAGQSLVTEYKVRLATYSDPKWFDGSKVAGAEFGYVEVLIQDDKSIYLLAGFESLDAAINARTMAKNRGFVDAVVVKDINGQLQKL